MSRPPDLCELCGRDVNRGDCACERPEAVLVRALIPAFDPPAEDFNELVLAFNAEILELKRRVGS